MNGYHDYVFDATNRQFIGRFEDMYRAENTDRFDSWDQDDPHRLDVHLVQMLVGLTSPHSIVDIGCGKGYLTSLLVHPNRTVLGCDVSETALTIARGRVPSAKFVHLSDQSIYPLVQFLFNARGSLGVIDIVVMSQVLSYIADWPNLIDIISTYSSGLCVALYVPQDPIGYVKSWDDVVETVSKKMDVATSLWDSTNNTGYLLATR